MNQEVKNWWNSLDMNDQMLCKLWGSMYGSDEQRIK